MPMKPAKTVFCPNIRGKILSHTGWKYKYYIAIGVENDARTRKCVPYSANRIILVPSLSVETSIRVVLYIPAVKAYRFKR